MTNKLRAEIQVVEGELLALRGFCLSPDAIVVEIAAKRRQEREKELAKLRQVAVRQEELELANSHAA
jgi:hypothetical protein